MSSNFLINEVGTQIIDVLNDGKCVVLPINGYSMFPTFIPSKTTVKIAKAQPRKYDIALFVTPRGQFVLHRIIKIVDNNFIALGDGETKKSKIMSLDCIVGIVQEYYYKDKTFVIPTKPKLKDKLWRMIRVIRRPIIKLIKICSR